MFIFKCFNCYCHSYTCRGNTDAKVRSISAQTAAAFKMSNELLQKSDLHSKNLSDDIIHSFWFRSEFNCKVFVFNDLLSRGNFPFQVETNLCVHKVIFGLYFIHYRMYSIDSFLAF